MVVQTVDDNSNSDPPIDVSALNAMTGAHKAFLMLIDAVVVSSVGIDIGDV